MNIIKKGFKNPEDRGIITLIGNSKCFIINISLTG